MRRAPEGTELQDATGPGGRSREPWGSRVLGEDAVSGSPGTSSHSFTREARHGHVSSFALRIALRQQPADSRGTRIRLARASTRTLDVQTREHKEEV